jgi:hypothetical protein
METYTLLARACDPKVTVWELPSQLNRGNGWCRSPCLGDNSVVSYSIEEPDQRSLGFFQLLSLSSINSLSVKAIIAALCRYRSSTTTLATMQSMPLWLALQTAVCPSIPHPRWLATMQPMPLWLALQTAVCPSRPHPRWLATMQPMPLWLALQTAVCPSMPQPDGSSASGMVILPRLRYAQVGAWTVVAGYILDHAFAICFSSENTSSEKAKLPGVAAGKAVFTWRKATSKTGRIKCVQVIPMCCPGVRDQS